MLACYDGSITPIRMLLQFNAQMIIKDKKGQLSWEQQGYKLGTPILKTKSAYICYFFYFSKTLFQNCCKCYHFMFPKRVVHTNYELGMLQNVCSIKIKFLLLWASHEVPLDLLIELNSVFL